MIQAITIITVSAIVAVSAIEICRPAQDHIQVITLVVGLVTMAIGQVLNLAKQSETSDKVDTIHAAVNRNTEIAKDIVNRADDAKVAAELAAHATAAALIQKER